jgi:RNA polymerase sigma-70 factor (ECF subfamily)
MEGRIRHKWAETLFSGMSQRLLRQLRGMKLSPDEAEDVLQETCERLVKASGKAAVVYSEAFVFRVARNIALNQLRDKRGALAAQPALECHLPHRQEVPTDQALESKQDLAQVLDAINTLPPRCREVFYLRHVEQLSHKEIATRLEISTKAVEKHLANGIRLTHRYFKAVREGKDFRTVMRETGS